MSLTCFRTWLGKPLIPTRILSATSVTFTPRTATRLVYFPSYTVQLCSLVTMSRGAQIQLTEQEEAICQLLDQTCSYIYRERPNIPEIDSTQTSGDGSQACEARIAGGWVRDKLLARDSDDLDISLSTL